jgi:hypothetical protein
MIHHTFFVISPVRGITSDEQVMIEAWVKTREAEGAFVYWPLRDTPQEDPSRGMKICDVNRHHLERSDIVAVYWNGRSTGSLFDLGMAWHARRPITLINESDVRRAAMKTRSKCFESVLLAWAAERSLI